MADETRGTAPVLCPKCKSPDTIRTGAFNVEPRAGAKASESGAIAVVYDRRCQKCGALFPETTTRPAR
jgi:predicted Zn-ribbon and HTH transcriptional regulator